ncbi:hypothetical protein H0H81_008633 [Sphagnurus paluster]|uniref:GH16 domain-containing protein n=1 Tax=Sphagnurus paluster TaxID=117069 RepID=A0A9P7K4L7_9AGAR|nr:hypothetical protein H0H81_008633 [Sphagnurus paluster]
MPAADPFTTPASSRRSSLRPPTSSSSLSPNDSPSSGPRSILRRSTTPPPLPVPAMPVPVPVPAPIPVPPKKQPRMRSHMISPDTPVPRPWTAHPPARASIAYYLTYVVIVIGIALGALQTALEYKGVQLDRKPLCLVLEEDFSNPSTVFADASGKGGTFFREVGMDGFGTGEFSMATASANNSFVLDGQLYIVPTLTADAIGADAVRDGTVYNITGCTFNQTHGNGGYLNDGYGSYFDLAGYTKACSAVSNATAGTVINPVQTARLSTKFSASIRYGKVEVRAKMPDGDWLWPAIWMLPRDEVYGPWPLSGEIDIAESRGNGLRYTAHGSNYVQGTLNWGPAQGLNGADKTYSWWTDKRKKFSSDFHTYSLEWTEDFLRISVDTRLHTLLDLRFDTPFFKRGQFPEVVYNGSSLTALQNPWINGTNATPFDQEFYLILDVAAGSTSGWFPEGQGDKPWLDRAQNPMLDFLNAQPHWYSTWPANAAGRGMVVDYVKMWKHCDGN